jgi:hypothetical protein
MGSTNASGGPRASDADHHLRPAAGRHRADDNDQSSGQGGLRDGWRVVLRVAIGPLAVIARRPVAWASWAAAALTALYMVWALHSAPGALLGVVTVFFAVRLPITTVVVLALVAEEIKPSDKYAGMTTLGSQLYFSAGKIPLLLPVVMTAILAALSQWWPARPGRLHRTEVVLLGSAAALAGLTIVVGLADGQSAFSAVNQNARPFILVLLGIAVGASLRIYPAERKPLAWAVGTALVGLMAAAAIAIPLGGSADPTVSRYFIYYDSALPAIAAAIWLALISDHAWRWTWQRTVIAVATPLVILFSFRRTIWIAAVLALVGVVVLTRGRRAVAGRVAVVSVATAVLVLAAPGFAADLGLRSASLDFQSQPVATAAPGPSGTTPKTGPPAPGTGPSPKATEADIGPTKAQHVADSNAGHVGDLRLGWTYVRQHLLTGVGPLSPQLPGLAAVGAERVYVHDEWLQDWLRYGPLAPLLVTVLLTAAIVLAVRALRNPESDVTVRAAAVFAVMLPACLVTAPFLSDTSRWPLLVGIAAGILVADHVIQSPTTRTRGALDVPRQFSRGHRADRPMADPSAST